MPGLTYYFQLQILDAGDPFSTNGQKYTTTDRDTIDRLLYLGAEGHHHNGATVSTSDPTGAPALTQATTGGTLPANTTIYYEYTWVDSSGNETGPSPYASITTPAPIAIPNPPSLSTTVGTGTLPAGSYFYALTAYVSTNTAETPLSVPQYIFLAATGEITLNLPTLPTGATGFNIYRLDPGAVNYVYLNSTTSTSYTDDNSVAENPNRIGPTLNTTNATNMVTITPPSAPPTGFGWNLYRTIVAGDWTNALLDTLAGATTFYQDIGNGTTTGTPPVASGLIPSPTKILLTGGAEVQGILPASMVAGGGGGGGGLSGIPTTEIEFMYPGTLTVTTGVSAWVCPWVGGATINSVTCILGPGSTPNAQNVIVDVKKGTGVTPTYSSIFSGTFPEVPVGQQVGSSVTPATTTLAQGDSLTSDITQVGGGTNTDHDLTIVVSLTAATSGGAADLPLIQGVNTVGTSGTGQTIPATSTATMNSITLSANCTLTFPTAQPGEFFTIQLIQGSGGPYGVTWPGTVIWPSNNTTPTLSSTVGNSDLFQFQCLDGSHWLGSILGSNF